MYVDLNIEIHLNIEVSNINEITFKYLLSL